MPVERSKGTTMITGNATLGYAALTCYHGMKLYLKHGIKPSRHHTPAAMRHTASQFTGKVYAKSRKGMETAMADLGALLDEKKDLDKVGDALVVNQTVGVETADA